MQTQQQQNTTQPPYHPSERLQKQIDRGFRYHSPNGSQPQRYVAIRDKAKELAELIAANTPESREQSLSISELESCVMWANAAIARNETQETPTV